VAGAFYPGRAPQLKTAVTDMLDSADKARPGGEIVAAVAPHAGYVFSGKTAARTFKALTGTRCDTMVIIGHDAGRGAVAYICPVDAYATPLGQVPVDREMVKKMLAFNAGIKPDTAMHSREHTVEVQLPFLQAMGKDCKIVPVLFGNPTAANCKILADAIVAAAENKKVFILASTDMSHYPPYEAARRVDLSTLDVMRSLDLKQLFDHMLGIETGGKTPGLQTAMCARGGVGTAMLFAKGRGADLVKVLGYTNSGDAPRVGSKNRVVGYCSVLFVKSEKN
jgi:AmmeMemoRadiSam system protein B